jgi:hypothetical protein
VEYRVSAENGATALYRVKALGVDERHPAPFSSVAEMAAYLAAFDGETSPEDPIYAILDENADDLDGPLHSNPAEGDPLGGVFDALAGRYVSLDISAWTGRLLPNSYDAGSGFTHLGAGTESRLNRDKLVAIKLPDTLEVIGDGVFANSIGLRQVVFPPSLKTIEMHSFKSCTFLEAVDLAGTKITYIHTGLFAYCYRLKSVVLPEGVTGINALAFSNCASLKTITLLSPKKVGLSIPAIGTEPFHECTALEHIYVPADLVDAYKADTLWKPWADMISPIGEEE